MRNDSDWPRHKPECGIIVERKAAGDSIRDIVLSLDIAGA